MEEIGIDVKEETSPVAKETTNAPIKAELR